MISERLRSLRFSRAVIASKRPTIWIAANTTWYIFNFRRRLIAALRARGYEIVAFAPRDEYVKRLEDLGVRHVHLELENAGTNPAKEALTLTRIAATLIRERPSVLLTYTPKINIYCTLAARSTGVEVVANVSGLGRAFTTGGWLTWVARRLYGLALRHPHTVFFQNEDDRSEFVAAKLVERTRTERLPGSGVDVDRFRPRGRERARGEARDAFVFLLVARMLREKGIVEYVEAARRLKQAFPQAEFRLLGFIDEANPVALTRTQLDAWNSAGIIRYLGTSDDVAAHYAEADCVVLPSYYREGVPRTLLEAASMAVPIVTTDWIGCRDAVDDGLTGYLCRPRDTDDLTRCMRLMLELPSATRDAMGSAGREKMLREFDERAVLARYIEVVDRITAPASIRIPTPTPR